MFYNDVELIATIFREKKKLTTHVEYKETHLYMIEQLLYIRRLKSIGNKIRIFQELMTVEFPNIDTCLQHVSNSDFEWVYW